MAKRDTAEYLAAAEDTMATEPLPGAMEAHDEPLIADYLAAGTVSAESAAPAANERAPLTAADIKYIVRLIGDFLPGAQAQTVRVFGQRCVALRGESGDILVVTSLSDMRTLLSAVQGAY